MTGHLSEEEKQFTKACIATSHLGCTPNKPGVTRCLLAYSVGILHHQALRERGCKGHTTLPVPAPVPVSITDTSTDCTI